MVKEHYRLFRGMLMAADIVMIVAAWGLAYWLRFLSGVVTPPRRSTYNPSIYLLPVAIIPIVWPTIFRWLNLYRPRRAASHRGEVVDLVKASTLAVLVLVTVSYLVFKTEVSRGVLLLFWVVSTSALIITRVAFREVLRFLRRSGYNLRHILVVGTGALARGLVARIERHREYGLRVAGLIAREASEVPDNLDGIPVLGGYADLPSVLRRHAFDEVVLALPHEDQGYLSELLTAVDDEIVDIKVVPDFLQFSRLRGGVEDFDGLAVVTLRTSPLVGWNSVTKRALDLVVGTIALIVAAPLMALIAVLVKAADGGPVLYRQERMGLDGRVFQMLKFRSMRVDAEAETGPVWARDDDPRVTWIGRLLRRTSLDELPQLWNVLKGEMSLTGPRPERPALVERFRAELPGYMLRHKIKAGMTGWAQVNGWRGNTSLERRLEHDLYYIQNWSIWLDLKILWLTLWNGFVNKNAY